MSTRCTRPALRRSAVLAAVLASALGALASAPSWGWGDEGHEVIALIAAHDLEPGVLAKAEALLEADASGLTPRDLAHEATWADRYRDSDRDGTRERYRATREWHFVDLELKHPHLAQACHGRPGIAPGQPASQGPAEDCIVDKVEEFEAELADPKTAPGEQRLALQYLLHLVGDLHQPLHASDDHDQGGNLKRVSAAALPGTSLHQYWDTQIIQRLDSDPQQLAARLLARVTAADRLRWRSGTPEQWAFETYAIARARAYGELPAPDGPNHYTLPREYLQMATEVTAEQLEKAGVRLAWLLNQALKGKD